MAKKKAAVNKSQTIRDYDAKNAGAKPAAVVDALKKQGVVVTAQQVSTVRFNSKKKTKKKRGRAGAVKKVAVAVADKVSLADLLSAKEFAQRVGGVEQAGEVLSALARLNR